MTEIEHSLAQVSPRGLFSDIAPAGAQRFLLAAIAAFAQRGFHGTTTRDIAQLAGSSSAGMYTYYATKLDLLFEVSLTVHDYVLDVMTQGVTSGTDPATRMRGLVRASVEFHADEHLAASVVGADFRALDEQRLAQIMRLRRRAKKLVLKEVTTGVESGAFSDVHVEGTSVAILRLMDVSSWYNPRGPMSPVELGRVYSDLVLRMLGASVELVAH
jgi:AcrR family transcriptional regulator